MSKAGTQKFRRAEQWSSLRSRPSKRGEAPPVLYSDGWVRLASLLDAHDPCNSNEPGASTFHSGFDGTGIGLAKCCDAA